MKIIIKNIILYFLTIASSTVFIMNIMRACCAVQNIPTDDPFIKWSNIIVSALLSSLIAYKMFPIDKD